MMFFLRIEDGLFLVKSDPGGDPVAESKGFEPANAKGVVLAFLVSRVKTRSACHSNCFFFPPTHPYKQIYLHTRGPTAQTRWLTGPATRGQGGQGCRGVSTFMSMLSSLQLAVVSE